MPHDNIFICENGESLELSSKGVARGPMVESGIVFVDGLSVGDTSQDVLNERTELGSQGVAAVACAVSLSKRELVGAVQLEMHGITGGDDEMLAEDVQTSVRNAVKRQLGKGGDKKELRKAVRDSVLSMLWDRAKQRPLTIVNLIEI